jgi:AsmA protein
VLSAKLKGQTPPATPVPEETKIANLSATANIKKGVLTNNDLRAATPFSRFIGQGTVDLATEKLDYVVSVKFTSSTEIITRTPYEKMNSIPLDIIIKGTFDEPSIKADFKKALNQLVDNELQKQKQKYKKDIDNKLKEQEQKIKDDLKKELEKKLKNMFKF